MSQECKEGQAILLWTSLTLINIDWILDFCNDSLFSVTLLPCESLLQCCINSNVSSKCGSNASCAANTFPPIADELWLSRVFFQCGPCQLTGPGLSEDVGKTSDSGPMELSFWKHRGSSVKQIMMFPFVEFRQMKPSVTGEAIERPQIWEEVLALTAIWLCFPACFALS